MCGIFGEFGDQLLFKDQFLQLNQLSENRGPDMKGYWSNDEYCQMGFNRLSIMDLTQKGNQPMITEDDRWVMTMNGEIYNFHEIRKKMGYQVSAFRSGSDAEVVLSAFNKWGLNKTLDALNGIFAIALLDTHEKKLYLIRDFAGVKPLYFGIKENVLVYSSQYDQVFRHPNFYHSRTPHLEHLFDYTQFGYISAPNAFFKSTWQVEPGEVVSFDLLLNKSKRKYYEFSVAAQDLFETDKKTVRKLDKILEKSVVHQLMGDVPVGTFLSGGIDSPLISYYTNEFNPGIETFTIGSENPSFDETESARYFASSLNVVNHLHHYSNDNLIQDINEHFKAFSEPFGDYSSLPTFQVCKMAKDHFSVILGGDGGDEIFWGYPRFLGITSHFHWFNWNMTARKLGAGIARKIGYNISYGVHLNNIGDWVIAKQSHCNYQTLNNILPGLSNSDFIKNLYYSQREFKNKTALLNWLRWNEFYGHLQRVLMKIDRVSMHHSLEVRVPFLDRDVLEISKRIHPELSISHNQPKYLLKKLMEEKYPGYSCSNGKMGFSFDIDHSLRTVLREEVCDLLIDRDPYPHNTFHQPSLKKYVWDFFQEKNGNEWGIWILFALQKWAKSFDINN